MDAHFDYTISWDEICKWVDKDLVDKLNRTLNEIQVFVKMSSGEDVELNDCIVHWEDAYIRTKKELDEIKDKVLELKEVFKSIKEDFLQKHEVGFHVSLNYDSISNREEVDDYVRFCLNWKAVTQYTPQAQRMLDKGIRFDLESWIDDSGW